MKTLLCAIALNFALEGAFFGLFPDMARKCMEEATQLNNHGLRAIGASALCASIILAWLAS